jgi:hypothetical protein
MARDFFIPGESLVQVKSRIDSGISALTQLGLAADAISVTPHFMHSDINVDAWGQAPADVQWMLAEVTISMNLIHVDRSVLDECLRLSMGNAPFIGTLGRAGQRLGNNSARFAIGNSFIGLNITSPVAGKPWRFFYAYLADNPVEIPCGVEKAIFRCNWRAIPFTQDPYGAGLGAFGSVLWDYTLDT